MRFGAILAHLKVTFIHLGPFWKSQKFFVFYTILAIFGPFLAILSPFWASVWPSWTPRLPQNEGGTGQNAPKTGVNHQKMRFGAILDHFKVTFIHFGPFWKAEKNSFFTWFWSFLAHFGPPFDPPGAPDRPQNEGGTGQNAPKMGVNHPKMRFGAILDHLKVTFIHFGPFWKVKNCSFLHDFGHFSWFLELRGHRRFC